MCGAVIGPASVCGYDLEFLGAGCYFQCTRRVCDVIVGSHVYLAVHHYCVGRCVVAGADLGLGSCYGDTCHCICSLKSGGCGILPSVVGKCCSVILLGVGVCGDGQRRLGNGQCSECSGYIGVLICVRKNVGVCVVVCSSICYVLHAFSCCRDGHGVSCGQSEYLACGVCSYCSTVVCHGVDFVSVELAIICPALCGGRDDQCLSVLRDRQRSGYVCDVIVGGHVCAAVHDYCVGRCVGAGADLGLGSCYGDARHCIVSLETYRCGILPSVICQFCSIVWFGVGVCRDGQRRLCDGQRSEGRCYAGVLTFVRENVGVCVVLCSSVCYVLHACSCCCDGDGVSSGQSEDLASGVCFDCNTIICHGVDLVSVELAVICPVLCGRCDDQCLAGLCHYQCSRYVSDVVVGCDICLTVHDYCTGCCVGAGADLGLGSCYCDTCHCICSLESGRRGILPAVICQCCSVVLLGVGVSRDGQRRLCDGQCSVGRCYALILVSVRKNVCVCVVLCRSIRYVLHACSCRCDGNGVACGQSEYLSCRICCCSDSSVCYSVYLIRVDLAVIRPALCGRCDDQGFSGLGNHQCSGYVRDVIVGGDVCLAVHDYCTGCCVGAGADLCLGSCYCDACHFIVSLESGRCGILPAVVCQCCSVVLLLVAVSSDGQRCLCDGQRSVGRCYAGILISMCQNIGVCVVFCSCVCYILDA